MTGHAMEDSSSDTAVVEHMHEMNVGSYRVFFRAETDAKTAIGRNDTTPVEIKASNPRYWGTKVMFQMISSGSTVLCHGRKSRGSLASVELRSLADVASEAMYSTRTT